jgi:tyrosyl-tRNA synthetase
MFYELLTDVPIAEVEAILAGHPKQAKLTLGKTVIAQYHPQAEADDVAERWEKEIGQGQLPEEIPTKVVPRSEMEDGKVMAVKLLVMLGLCGSSSDARRLIAQGGASIGEEKTKIERHDQMIAVEDGLLIRAGKKKICRVDVV